LLSLYSARRKVLLRAAGDGAQDTGDVGNVASDGVQHTGDVGNVAGDEVQDTEDVGNVAGDVVQDTGDVGNVAGDGADVDVSLVREQALPVDFNDVLLETALAAIAQCLKGGNVRRKVICS